MQDHRVYSFLHVPVQSGSDGVLGEMKREYTVAEFCRVVDTLRDRWDNYFINCREIAKICYLRPDNFVLYTWH